MRSFRYLLGAAFLPGALAAQTSPAPLQIPLGNSGMGIPAPVPSATPTPAPFPSPVFSPAPLATLTPTPLTSPTSTPVPTRTQRARAEPPPELAPAATASPAPTESPTPLATPEPSPSPTAATMPIETVVLPRTPPARAPLWPWFAGAAVLLLALAALLLRRRGAAIEPEVHQPEPEPAAPPPLPPATRLRLDIRPTRAGTNLLTATVEAEVVVTNVGDTPAHEIRAALGLLGADGKEAAGIEALATQPVTQPAVPPFTLAPGEERCFRAVAALPLDAVPSLAVNGRPLFVPLAVVTVAWHDGNAARRTTRGFAVGVERVGSAKLAPLWLDGPSRSFEGVAARSHGDAREE